MDNKPLVSVLMPAYNQAEYIKDALDSLLNQTYRNWEVAVVDDGSPDNVAEIVKPYAEKDARIRFYHTKNGGVSCARNFAASVTSGEYIIPLDADDIFKPDYIEKCITAFQKNPELDVVYCQWKMFGAVHKTPELEYKGYRDLLIYNSIFCSAMYRRSDFNRIGGYDTEIPYGFEDWEFWIRLICDNSKVYQIPKQLFLYRIKSSSRSTGSKEEDKQATTHKYIFRKHMDLYMQQFPDYISVLQQNAYFRHRNEKWKRRSLVSRLWYAIKGTI